MFRFPLIAISALVVTVAAAISFAAPAYAGSLVGSFEMSPAEVAPNAVQQMRESQDLMRRAQNDYQIALRNRDHARAHRIEAIYNDANSRYHAARNWLRRSRNTTIVIYGDATGHHTRQQLARVINASTNMVGATVHVYMLRGRPVISLRAPRTWDEGRTGPAPRRRAVRQVRRSNPSARPPSSTGGGNFHRIKPPGFTPGGVFGT
jgi:hypothetical protein